MIPREQLLTLYKRLLVQVVAKRGLAKTSQQPRPEPRHYRLWAIPGDFVRRKDILAKQSTMKWYPGLHVGLQEDRCLYALRDGIMIITEEEFHPDWTHPLVKRIYVKGNGEKRAPNIVRYLHVIPKTRVSEFKLVDLV